MIAGRAVAVGSGDALTHRPAHVAGFVPARRMAYPLPAVPANVDSDAVRMGRLLALAHGGGVLGAPPRPTLRGFASGPPTGPTSKLSRNRHAGQHGTSMPAHPQWRRQDSNLLAFGMAAAYPPTSCVSSHNAAPRTTCPTAPSPGEVPPRCPLSGLGPGRGGLANQRISRVGQVMGAPSPGLAPPRSCLFICAGRLVLRSCRHDAGSCHPHGLGQALSVIASWLRQSTALCGVSG